MDIKILQWFGQFIINKNVITEHTTLTSTKKQLLYANSYVYMGRVENIGNVIIATGVVAIIYYNIACNFIV